LGAARDYCDFAEQEPEPMIKVIKKIEYYRIISYYSLVKKRRRKKCKDLNTI